MKTLLIAGPCSAETESQLFETAAQLHQVMTQRQQKLSFFRAGVWKPRSQPNDFNGAGKPALKWLQNITQEFHFPVCVEVATPQQVDWCEEADIHAVWIGSRTGVNPFIVQDLADSLRGRNFTVMIKNPIVPDLKLWSGNIERMARAGITDIIAIHRGFSEHNQTVFRNNPAWEIPIELKIRYPEIPILCDPSHIAGDAAYIEQIAQAALDYGFNGLMVETHVCPAKALSDARQQLTPTAFGTLLDHLVFKSSLTTPAENELRKQRSIINTIDTQLSVLLKQRMDIVDAIAQIKKDNNLPVVQPQQWNRVVKKYREQGADDNYYQEFLSRFLELLHNTSIERQRQH